MVDTATNGHFARTPTAKARYSELGSSGLNHWGGVLREEMSRDLWGDQALRVYSQMAVDPIVAATLRALVELTKGAGYTIEPTDPDDPAAVECADVVDSALGDMSHSWDTFWDELASMFIYGWAYFEIVYKQRAGEMTDPASQYDDGRVGWRKWAPRPQDTRRRWELDDTGGIQGMWQIRTVSGVQHAEDVFLPIDTCLLFRVGVRKNSPEGQALECGTMLPTPHGWSEIGDLTVGDLVYDEQGMIRHVTAVKRWASRPVYKVRFSHGAEIVADAEHLWSVRTFNDRTNGKPPRIMTTREIAASLDANPRQFFDCGRAPILEGTRRTLPFDPYLLGYWLGDGYSDGSGFAVAAGDVEHLVAEVERCGYAAKDYNPVGRCVPVSGMRPNLRAAGVLGDKHIPDIYLRAPVADRLALLQGLMDADGHSPTAKDKSSWFSTTNVALRDGAAELIRTLGSVPRVGCWQSAGRSGGVVNGRPVVATRDLWSVRFRLDMPCHRLPRKAATQSLVNMARTVTHHIEAVEPAGTADTVCIEVDSPSHLYLAGEAMVPTHNSLLRSAYEPWFHRRRLQVLSAIGADRNLAGIPRMYVPSEILHGTTPEAQAALASYQLLGEQLRADETAYVMFPSDCDPVTGKPLYQIDLMSGAGSSGVDVEAQIARVSREIAMSVLADVIFLGHEQVGTQALVRERNSLLEQSLESIGSSIADVFTRHAIPRLCRLNGFPRPVWPTMQVGEIGEINLAELGQYIGDLSGAGVNVFSELEQTNWLLRAAGIPEVDELPEEPTPPTSLYLPGQPPPALMPSTPVDEAQDAEEETVGAAKVAKMIRREDDGWHVYSGDGAKHLGGPYRTKAEAVARLAQVEHFKNDD